eukprot:COSAG01_NODE_4246_length_5209_cov_23.270841_3_plen_788_part_00
MRVRTQLANLRFQTPTCDSASACDIGRPGTPISCLIFHFLTTRSKSGEVISPPAELDREVEEILGPQPQTGYPGLKKTLFGLYSDEIRGKFIKYPEIRITLKTDGAHFTCPLGRCCHAEGHGRLSLSFFVGETKLICSCTRGSMFGTPEGDRIGVQAWDNCRNEQQDITLDMVTYFISRHLNEEIHFLNEKGIGFAAKKALGGYDLYSTKFEKDLCAAWAKKILRGCEHNFGPVALAPKAAAVRDIPFKDAFNLLKVSEYRCEYREVGFFPARPPYTEVFPKSLRPPADMLNTFDKLGITEEEARDYCLENKLLTADDFETKAPAERIFDYYVGQGVLDVEDDDETRAVQLRELWTAQDFFVNESLETQGDGWVKLRAYLLEQGAVTTDEWRPHPTLTAEGRAKLDALMKPMTDHVLDIVCRGDTTDCKYFFDYDAHAVQKPWEKPGVAKVLRSDGKGAGKGAVVDPLIEILGSQEPHFHAAEVSSADSILEGGFNGMLSQKVAIVLDEAYWAGSAKDKGKLRSLITCANSTIRLMHTNPYKEQSFARVFFMSNDQQVVPYDSACERRYKCYDLLNTYKGIQTDATRAHFDPIYAIPTEVHALFLYHRNIAGFNPRKFKIGAAEQGQMSSSLSAVQAYWLECLDRGFLVEEKERKIETRHDVTLMLPHTRVWKFGAGAVPKSILYEDFRSTQCGRAVGNAAFFKELKALLPDNLFQEKSKMPFNYGGISGRPPAIAFGPLADYRAAWQAKYGDRWVDDDVPHSPSPHDVAPPWVREEPVDGGRNISF